MRGRLRAGSRDKRATPLLMRACANYGPQAGNINLLIDWRRGEEWFFDTLVDADPASNAASWQWVAGSGADASPYFRIFNPFTQGEKFDPNGDYVRRWVPELADMPRKYMRALSAYKESRREA